LDLVDLDYDQHSFWSDREWPKIYEEGSTKFKARLPVGKVLSTKRALLRRMGLLFKVRRFDKVFVHREATPIGPPWFEWFVAKVFRKPIIFDFDDAIWLPNVSEANKKIVGKFKNHSKTTKICSWAQTVTVGNSFLADYASQFCNDVRIIPTTIDTERYHNPALFEKNVDDLSTDRNDQYKVLSIKPARPSGGYKESGYTDAVEDEDIPFIADSGIDKLLTIGWTGAHSTLKQVEPLFPTLEDIYKKKPFRFLLIADRPPEKMPEFVEFKKWNKETEIQDLMEIDIGIMPLFDTEWEKGKCGFKALQYLALEKPAIVSGVGVNTEIIRNNKNGIICEPMHADTKIYPSWKKALLELLHDREKRHSFGTQGRQTVIENYSVKSQISNCKSIFEST